MIKRLQDISFRVSRYFRPLETWHCGGMEDGGYCVLGPNEQRILLPYSRLLKFEMLISEKLIPNYPCFL